MAPISTDGSGVPGVDRHLLALVRHVSAARAGNFRVRVRNQPLALVLPQYRQKVQTCRAAHVMICFRASHGAMGPKFLLISTTHGPWYDMQPQHRVLTAERLAVAPFKPSCLRHS